ncbi:hypothetical protein [Permianibacter aggregans]|uniref:Uncharacterized protein n=1 Tax=Permianibacter aggregans TaxID=1510150 RepID=A0A4R6UMG9_9GAMM|nr:hypothetical protein [Permianibacter aggregans]QGX40890.1 hypothetical protein E2H98_14950 [Permianibacter aggregans]TDQ48290.1 hypothetical protein EV696_10726 [Permianibacter aggregans]
MEYKEKAIEEVRRITSDAKNCRIVNVHPDFMNGTLYVVGFDTDEGKFHNYVYVHKNEIYLAKNEALLLSWISKKTRGLSLLEQIGGSAGIIGLIITLTIVFLVIFRPEAEVPKELWAALTAVLAFYFGSKVAK